MKTYSKITMVILLLLVLITGCSKKENINIMGDEDMINILSENNDIKTVLDDYINPVIIIGDIDNPNVSKLIKTLKEDNSINLFVLESNQRQDAKDIIEKYRLNKNQNQVIWRNTENEETYQCSIDNEDINNIINYINETLN